MMDYLSFLLCILVSCATIHHLILSLLPQKKKLPPGPYPLPVIGNLFMIGDNPHNSITNLAKIYGPLMYLQLGSQKAVVISSASMAKQVLHKNDVSVCYRTLPHCLTALQHHELSFLFLPVGDRWKLFRRISVSHVFSRNRLDSSQFLRKKKLDDLLSYVKLHIPAREAVEIGQVAFNTTLNLLSNTFFSVDLADIISSSSSEFKEVFWQIMVETSKPNFADYFPILKYFDPQRIKRRMGVHLGKIIDLFSSIITQRLTEKQGCFDTENDVLDSLLKISHEKSEELELSHIPHLLLELFVGGTDTSSNTIEWAMAELLCSPDKMKRAREELEHVVGKGITIKEEDVVRLPYLQAVIKETFRKHGPLPFIYRQAVSDIEVCGFTVQKNTQILINLLAIGSDSSLWNNPAEFQPERFLSNEIDLKGRDFELIPFGAGRRICPGLPMAMRMVPLMLASLINCFEWKLEDGIKPETMDMNAKFGLTFSKAQPLLAIPIAII